MAKGRRPLRSETGQDIRTHAVAAADERMPAESVEQRQQHIGGRRPAGERRRAIASAMAAVIGRDNVRARGKRRDHLIPEPRMKAGRVEQEQRWPVPPRSPFEPADIRSEEHTSELQSLMRNSYAVLCLKKNNQ